MAFYEDLPVGTLRATKIYLAGTEMTSSAAELSYLDITAPGTVQASKAVVVDSNKDASAFRNVTLTNLDAGASGTAGSVDIFPSTASKGKIAIAAADSAGDTTTTITNASQAGARTYTIPDAGASASFVMTEGAQTVNGVKTFGGGIAFGAAATLDVDSAAVAATGNDTTQTATVTKMAGTITTGSLTTAANATTDVVLTLTGVAAGDLVLVTMAGGTNTTPVYAQAAVATSNTITVTLRNGVNSVTALNGTVAFHYLWMKA